MMQPTRCVISFDETNDPSSGSFLFEGETHTMGNALRQTIVSNPAVDYCGYSVPHPAENKMRIRIQAAKGENIIDIMNQGIENFAQWCSNMEGAFDAATTNL
jgi:DNA-directed RNA polymerase I and III subunit RPAC2